MMGVSKCALTVFLCLTLSGLPALAQEQPPAPADSGPPPTQLSLAQAVQMSLKNNLDVQVASFTPRLREQDILREEAAFDPNAGGFAEKQDNSTPTQNVFDVEFDPNAPPTALELITVDETLHRYGMGFADRLRWGADYSADLFMTRRTSTSANSLLPTTYFTALVLAYNQSFLRGWGNEVNTTRITLAQTNLDISRAEFRGQVLDVLRRTEDAYWELVFARQDLEVNLESLKLAQELLKLNRIKVQVGTLPPIEITTAEAEVASREQNVIVAENAVRDAEDTLRLVLNMPKTDQMWSRPIAPGDMPVFVERPVDLQRELDQAIQERPELQEARFQVKNAETQLRFDRRQLKWDLNGYARYQLSGLSGDIPQGGFFEAQNQDFVDALDLIPDREFPSWTLGVNVNVPIGNNAAQAAYVGARLSKEQAEINYEALKLTAEVDVRTAARGIDTNRKRIQAAEKNVELQRKKVEAEQKKFENGMSTSFQVLEFQEDLTTALGQLNRALVDYRKSLTALERAKGTLDDYLNVEVQ
jgi:outer membrane protein TolC